MKLEEIVSKMSKLYLGRLVDSFLRDVPKDDEEKMRRLILKNKDEFVDHARIENKLNFIKEDRDTGLLNKIILKLLLNENGYILTSDVLKKRVQEKEKEIIEESKKENVLKHSDPEALRIYERVLKAAWRWQDSISSHEQNILDVLKEELDLSLYEHRILESKLGFFPQKNNKIHGRKKIKEALKDLQYRGLVARIRDENTYFVIPAEIAEIMRDIMKIELRNEAYLLLLQELKKMQLKDVLRDNNLPVSGRKKDLCERIINARIKPSTSLESLTSSELSEFLRSLEDVKITGTKSDKINEIIGFYDKLITHSVKGEDPREQYYNYIIELAERDYEQLRGNNIIEKDREIEQFFEKATSYLFEILFGHEPVDMKGNENPDGKLKFNKDEVVLWDNKSSEKEYNFPDTHFNQFERYIKGEQKRVTLFLIIVPSCSEKCIQKVQKLKVESHTDTDVGLITAENLKYAAETWRDYSTDDTSFNLEVLNYTGMLTKNVLKQRMEWLIN